MNKPNPNGLTFIQRCEHKYSRGSENWDDLTISFCQECGTIIVTNDCGVKYISPVEAWIYSQMAIAPTTILEVKYGD